MGAKERVEKAESVKRLLANADMIPELTSDIEAVCKAALETNSSNDTMKAVRQNVEKMMQKHIEKLASWQREPDNSPIVERSKLANIAAIQTCEQVLAILDKAQQEKAE